jgi:hypothetical protein
MPNARLVTLTAALSTALILALAPMARAQTPGAGGRALDAASAAGAD